MKRSGIATVVVALALATAPLYGQDTRGQAGKPSPPQPGPGEPAQHGRSDSRSFIDEMAVVGMAEVQLGRMAAERASDSGVKAFGQMMVTDHTQAGNELKQVASQMGVSLPTQIDAKHRALADKLSKLQGSAFDREYINAMVEGHQEVAGKLRARTGGRSTSTAVPEDGRGSATRPGERSHDADRTQANASQGSSGGAGDQALTQWATKTLPTVEQHLMRARELQPKVGR